MKRPVLSDYLGTVRDGTRMRLDKLGDAMPAVKPQPPMGEYLQQAQRIAESDAEFAAKLRLAMEQYQRLGG